MNVQQVRLPKPRKNMIQHQIIPQEVLSQLRAHSSSLPASIPGMVTLLLESGMRVSDLCMLPCDCLVRDSTGDWFLRYRELKSKQERIIPLSSQAVMVVQEQQALRLDKAEGAARDYLFLNTKGQLYSPRSFLDILNRIARERDIRDETGNIWRFRSLQFRHTVMTHLFRSGVPLYVLQRYLGHRTQEMIEEDKHLSGTTEQTVEQERQAMRLQMDALPQKFGLCDLHTHLSPCPHKTFTEYYTRLRTSCLSDKIIRLRDIYNASKQQKLPEEDDPQHNNNRQ